MSERLKALMPASAQDIAPGTDLIVLSIPVEGVDPLAVFAAAAGQERRFWSRPSEGFTLVAIGRSWSLPNPTLPDLTASVRTLNVDHRGAPGAEPAVRLLGSFPFNPEAVPPDGLALTLPRLALSAEAGQTTLRVCVPTTQSDVVTDLENAIGEVAELLPASRRVADPLQSVEVIDLPDRSTWMSTVEAALSEIQAGSLSKVVLARRQRVTFATAPDPVLALERLISLYPDTAVFAVDTGTRCFLGASPEGLVRLDGSIYRIDCLAGTIRRDSDERDDSRLADELLADPKNRREHTAVVEFIRESMEPISDRMTVDPSPSVRTVRNLHHILTRVSGELHDINTTVLDIAARLNPTPAMCGVPRNIAIEFIQNHEGFDRGPYAGGVGWVDLNGSGDIAVGIRSGLIEGNDLTLIAGCGIVAGSEPSAEWQETEIKLIPMRSAFGLE